MSSPAPPVRKRSKFRAVVRFLAALVVLLLVLLAAAPYLLSTTPMAGWAVRNLFRNVRGSVTVRQLSLSWFSPPKISGFEIRSPADEPVVLVDQIELAEPLWRLVTDPYDIGRVRVDGPHATLILQPQGGSNFRRTFPPLEHPMKINWLEESIALAIGDAQFTWQLAGSEHRWSVAHVQLAAALRPDRLVPSGQAEFTIDQGTIFEHWDLSPPMCHDVLKFVAPVMARVTQASGQISLMLDGGRIPAREPRRGQVAGTLKLETVDVGPGTLVQTLARVFRLPTVVHLARDSNVKFVMHDGRVDHSGLEFGIEAVRVRTSGWVDFDENVSLLAEMYFQFSPENVAERPWLAKLNNKMIKLPISGTLNQMHIDWKALGAESQGNLPGLFAKLLDGQGQPEEGLLSTLEQRGVLTPAKPGEPATVNLPAVALDVLDELMKRRRERLANQPPAPSPAPAPRAAPAPAPAEAPPRRGLLGRAIDRLRGSPPPQPEPEQQPQPQPASP